MSSMVSTTGLNIFSSAASSANSSTWVPLLIAVLGFLSTLAGVIFTQFWNSRLEARRWERERSRQQSSDAREDSNRTYEHRREAYVDFLRDMERLRRAYTDVRNPPKPPREVIEALWDLWTAVMIYGTPEAQEITQRCGDAFGILWGSWNENLGDAILDDLMESWNELLLQARKDLGVPELPAVNNLLTPKSTNVPCVLRFQDTYSTPQIVLTLNHQRSVPCAYDD